MTSHECHCVSNHRQFHCLFNRLFWRTWKKTPKHCVNSSLWGERNSQKTEDQYSGKYFHFTTSPCYNYDWHIYICGPFNIEAWWRMCASCGLGNFASVGLSPVRRSSGIYFGEMLIEMQIYLLRKMCLNISSAKYRTYTLWLQCVDSCVSNTNASI